MALTVYTSDSDIFAEYTCLPGNQPQNNKNWIGIWEGTQVLWETAPLAYQYIRSNNPSDALCIYQERALNMSYIIGYGTGSLSHCGEESAVSEKGEEKTARRTKQKEEIQHINIGTVGATIQVTTSGTAGTQILAKIAAISVGNNTLLLEYTTPQGNIPSTNKNWVGIWPGSVVSYNGNNVLYRQEVRSDFNTGQICIQGFAFTIDTTYTIAYATGPDWSDIAATVTFTTQGYSK